MANYIIRSDDGTTAVVSTNTPSQFVVSGALRGPAGATGATGPTGPTGATGAGVPTGGTVGQFLKKNSSTNYDTSWSTLAIASLSDAGTLATWALKTAPSGVVIGTTDSQVLTNKTISGASNTLSSIANSSLTNSSVTIGSTSVALGATAATIAGLTLTSPKINVGSDATGDIYYRDSGGNLVRLGIGSSTQVLTVSGGLPSWQAATGGGGGGTWGSITGTLSSQTDLQSALDLKLNISSFVPAGADKQIQFNDAGADGVDSTFTYDKALKRMGINSAVPGSTLEVNGTFRAVGAATFSSTINVTGTSTLGALTVGAITSPSIATFSANGILAAATDRMVLSNVSNSSSGAPVQMSPRLRFTGNSWDTGATAFRVSDWTIENLTITGNPASSSLRFGNQYNAAGYTYPVTFLSSGFVGIGQTVPTTILHTQITSGSAGANVFLGVNTDANGAPAVAVQNNSTGVIRMGYGGTTVSGLASQGFINSTNGISIGVGGSSATSFLFNSSGNMGIGTSSPTQRLHVAGNFALEAVPSASAPTLATGGAGVLTGSYTYIVSYVNATGETDGTASIAYVAAAEQITVTIPVSTNTTVTSRRIYRTQAGGSVYNLVTTIANNTTTSYIDNATDASIVAAANNKTMNTTGGTIYSGATKLAQLANASGGVSVGAAALNALTYGTGNVAMGVSAGLALTTGSSNTIIGTAALTTATTGVANTAIGYTAGLLTTGGNNTYLGTNAGRVITTGSQNVFIGSLAGFTGTTITVNNAIGIGYNVQVTANNSIVLGNASITSVTTSGVLQTGGYKSSGGSTGASATTGGATFADGLYISGSLTSGTVTTSSVVSTNGFAGSVANPTTTPAITISTTVTGILSGNGTAISAATAGTDYLSPSATQTVTATRITKRVGTAVSSATPTINTDSVDYYELTAQAANITSFTTNLSGTPTNAQTLWVSIVGTGPFTIAWGASFESSTGGILPTTLSTTRQDIALVWNAVTSKWRCVGVM